MYTEHQPSSGRGLIDTIWTYCDNPSSERFNIIPDSCTDLIFDLGIGQAFVSGVMSRFQRRSLAKASQLIGIRLKAEKFSQLTRIPACETTDVRIPAPAIISQFDRHFMQNLLDRDNSSAQISLIEKALVEINGTLAPHRDRLIASLAAEIRAKQGKVNLHKMAAAHFISLRQLERRFKQKIGLSPKAFASIVRLRQAKAEIAKQPAARLYDIAYCCGFYDQAHMANEFKRLTGEQPGHFRASRA